MSAPVLPPSPSSSFNVSWDEYPASKGYIFAVRAGVRKVLFAIEIESKRCANCGGGYVKVGGGGESATQPFLVSSRRRQREAD